jgi:hypothetical protein
MKMRKIFLVAASLYLLTGITVGQAVDPVKSITKDELRDHIFFLASDFLNGRVAATDEYEIAANYVASQFQNAGLEPGVKMEDGSKSYLQGVPFARTTYSDVLKWAITKGQDKKEFIHGDDFKVMFGNNLNYQDADIAWVGYGIEEPEEDWNDFEGLDLKGKVVICMSGAPEKDGKRVFPKKVHEKYIGQRGFQSKIRPLFGKGGVAVILVDPSGSVGANFDQIPSSFAREKVVYKGGNSQTGMGNFPSIYMADSKLLSFLIPGYETDPGQIKPQIIKDASLSSSIEVLKEDEVLSSNVIGIVPGIDPVLKDEYIVVGAHLDHVAPSRGEICNGADDNASGSSGVMEIAEALAVNPCKRSVVFITYTAEEKGLLGSRYFLESELIPRDKIKFNINLDMIGRTSPDNEKSRAHYAVTHKKYVDQLEKFIAEVNDGVTDFPIIVDNDEDSPGGSDHQTFISAGIPAFFFFSGVHPDLHQPGDDADKIDYPKAESISRLAYLLACKLANMEEVPAFTD